MTVWTREEAQLASGTLDSEQVARMASSACVTMASMRREASSSRTLPLTAVRVALSTDGLQPTGDHRLDGRLHPLGGPVVGARLLQHGEGAGDRIGPFLALLGLHPQAE